jgi:hypothetical protein
MVDRCLVHAEQRRCVELEHLAPVFVRRDRHGTNGKLRAVNMSRKVVATPQLLKKGASHVGDQTWERPRQLGDAMTLLTRFPGLFPTRRSP